MGTASEVIDYKTGRQVHLLSQGEVYWYETITKHVCKVCGHVKED